MHAAVSEPALSVVEREKVDDGNTIKQKCYINAPVGRVAIYTQTYDQHTFGTTYDTKYCHRDHLGSVDVLTDSTGAVLERDSFDAWGFRRTTDWQSQRPIGSTSIVSRGFTGHEQLDSLGLVNMNGRIYDPGIGRFVSADPFVQAPTQTQNYNRYSYVLNNPLSFTDPSGFNFLNNFGKWLNKTLGPTGAAIAIVVATVVAVALQQHYLVPALAGTLAATTGLAYGAALSAAAVIVSANAGFTAAFMSASLAGATLGQAFQAGLIGGAIAAATAAAFEYGLPALSNAMNPNSQVQMYSYVKDPDSGAILELNPVSPEEVNGQSGKIGINGIFQRTPLQAAQRMAEQLPSKGYLAYNPSNGFLADIIEAGADMFSHQGSQISRNMANILSPFDLTNSQIIAHSQGAAILNRALEHLSDQGVNLVGLNVTLNGGAVNYTLTQAEYARFGANLTQANSHVGDMVSNIVGGNALTSFRPWRIITSIFGIPFLDTQHSYSSSEVIPAIP